MLVNSLAAFQKTFLRKFVLSCCDVPDEELTVQLSLTLKLSCESFLAVRIDWLRELVTLRPLEPRNYAGTSEAQLRVPGVARERRQVATTAAPDLEGVEKVNETNI